MNIIYGVDYVKCDPDGGDRLNVLYHSMADRPRELFIAAYDNAGIIHRYYVT